jgi:hypothetical protein
MANTAIINMDIQNVANPSVWADQGGLIGLVIMALFVMLGIFLLAQSKIYAMHREDQQKMMILHADERAAWSQIVDERQKETNAVINGFTAAINKLSRSRRIEDVEE